MLLKKYINWDAFFMYEIDLHIAVKWKINIFHFGIAVWNGEMKN